MLPAPNHLLGSSLVPAKSGGGRFLALIGLLALIIFAPSGWAADKPKSAEKSKSTSSTKPGDKNKSTAKPKSPDAPKPAPPPPAAPRPLNRLDILKAMRDEMPSHKVALKNDVAFNHADLDHMLSWQIPIPEGSRARIIGDEQFIRRVYLDTTGKLPTAKAVQEFTAKSAPNKRSQLVDELLQSDDFAQNWARYWRDVIVYTSEVNNKKMSPDALQEYLAGQFKRNTGWDMITAELLAADGKDKDKGVDNFLLAQDNKPGRMASEMARIFMGINIQCAECHDHPFDQWKRHQFHELAAFFEPNTYYMPSIKNPGEKTEMSPKFLLGEVPARKLNGEEKRVAVAAFLIYNPQNYWFARAYVNRIWNELFGDGFYAIDSLGPDAEVQYKLVVNRLAAVLRYKDFRPKWLFETILKSQAYQRDIRTITEPSERFTALRPTRLRGDQVADAVTQVVADAKTRGSIRRTFSFDPSLPQADIGGSIQQALVLMNNPALQERISKGPLTQDLLKIADNTRLADELYLRILCRHPTDKERTRTLNYLKQVKDREEAVQDLVWTLLNSTEFITRR